MISIKCILVTAKVHRTLTTRDYFVAYLFRGVELPALE